MKNTHVWKIGNTSFNLGEIVFIDGSYAKIKEIKIDEIIGYIVTVEDLYTMNGIPYEESPVHTLVSYTDVHKSIPILRKRIEDLKDEERRLKQILSQCQR